MNRKRIGIRGWLKCIAVALLAYCYAPTLTAQTPPPDIKEVKVYGNSAQFIFRSNEQLTAGQVELTNWTRIKIRFRVFDTANNIAFSSWKLTVESLEPSLSLDGGSSSDDISLSQLELRPSSSIAPINTSLSSHNVTLLTTPQVIAEGNWTTGLSPSTNWDTVVEAEIIITYILKGPFSNYKDGVYLANLKFQLEEQ